MTQGFGIALRGYDRGEVDKAIALIEAGGTPSTEFQIQLRGYNREQVDAYIEALLARRADPQG